jgi:signal transduction histidine kinase
MIETLTRPPAATLADAIAGFVAHLDRELPVAAVSADYRHARGRFESLAAGERANELAPLYLLWQRDVLATGADRQKLGASAAELVKRQFPALAEHRDFALVLARPREQERLLCQLLLIRTLRHLAKIPGAADDSLAALRAWLEAAPKVRPPVPMNLRSTVPAHNSEWMTLFFRLAHELYLAWEARIGGDAALACFERAFDEMWYLYSRLESLSIIVNLLPHPLLDSEKLARLSRSQIRHALLQRLGDLNVLNARLADQNEALGTMRRELEAAQSGLERRVAERTAELQKLNEELRAAKESAERADRTKSEFLANISHELRTPLNAIMGFSEVIRDALFGPVDPHYRSYATDIHESGRHLLAVINDILDLTKLESGRFDLHEEAVSVSALVETCRDMVAAKAKERGLHLAVRVPAGLPRLRADPLRLRQILLNLLSNAVKFTPSGGRIVASVQLAPDGGMLFEIKDTGIGMKAGDIALALEPFRQIDSQLNRTYEGTGLGLPLVKRLTELHDGRLEIVSAQGQGTTVLVRIPPERVLHPRERQTA